MTVSTNKAKTAKARASETRATKAAAPKSTATKSAGPLTRVGVKEFRDKATQLLAQDTPFAVERHGKVIGLYTPLTFSPERQARAAAAAEQLGETMNRVASEMGLSREELEDLLVGDLP